MFHRSKLQLYQQANSKTSGDGRIPYTYPVIDIFKKALPLIPTLIDRGGITDLSDYTSEPTATSDFLSR